MFSLQATVIDALNELLTELESRCDILCILVHKLCAIFLCLSEGIAVVLSFGTNTLTGKKRKVIERIEQWYKLIVQYRHSTQDTWEKIVLLHHKRFSSFFCKQTNNIHEFEGCFLRGQVSSKGFIVFNGCIVEYLNFIGPVAKRKKNVRVFCFQQMLRVDNLLPNVPV